MPSGSLLPVARQTFLDGNGNPIANGKVYFYAAGGYVTPQTVYQDAALTIPHASPVVLDSAGRATIYVSGSNYAMRVETAAGALVYAVDPVPSTSVSSSLVTDTVSGRLTLESGLPVTLDDRTARTTLYFTPYRGNHISLYNGSSWGSHTFSEISHSLAGLTASMPYDVFVYSNSGVVTLQMVAWASATTRSTALTTQDGVYVKSGASGFRFLGTVYINSTGGQTDDSMTKRYVWNYYNRVPRPMRRTEGAVSWTYTTDAYRQANGNSLNQLDFIIGVAEGAVRAFAYGVAEGAVGGTLATGIAHGNTTGIGLAAGCICVGNEIGATGLHYTSSAELHAAVLLGRNVLTWLERAYASASGTWYSNAGPLTTGITATIEG